jgi:hypothetical protein
MTRVIWGRINDRLILPYPDIDPNHRDKTDDQVTVGVADPGRFGERPELTRFADKPWRGPAWKRSRPAT